MLIDADVPSVNLKTIIEKNFPTCESLGQTNAAAATVEHKTTTRNFSPRWPAARFIDENGVVSDYDSPSELYTKLTGKPLSGSICTSPEHHPPICYPATTVESFRIWGYTVLGNGEEPPASDPANWLHSNNVKRQAVIDETNIWKEHLKASNKKFMVVDPKWIKKQEAMVLAEETP
jgi:hypothetical protein